jgi:hypothetical protein
MGNREQLALRREPGEGVAHQVFAFAENLEQLLTKHEVATVHPERQIRRRVQLANPGFSVEVDQVERSLRGNREQAGRRVGAEETFDDLVHRRIRQHIAVVGEEELVTIEVRPHPSQAFADARLDARVHERDAPLADVGFEQLDLLAALREDEVVR